MSQFYSENDLTEESAQRALRDKDRQLSGMREIALALGTTLDLDELLQILMDHITALMGADRSTLYLLDAKTNELWSKIAQGEALLEIRLPVGQGLAGWVAQNGRRLNIADAYVDKRFHPHIDSQTGYQTRSVLVEPIHNARNSLLGVVQVLNKHSDQEFSSADELLLNALTSQIAVAIENATLYADVMRRNRELKQTHNQLAHKVKELDLLVDVERAMSQAVTTEELLNSVLRRTLELVEAEAGAIVFADEESKELYFQTAVGGSPEAMKKVRIRQGEGIVGWVIERGEAALVNDAKNDPRHLFDLSNHLRFVPRNILCVPLAHQHRVIGALELLNKKQGRNFSDEDLRLTTLLAGQIAKGVDTAKQRESREKDARLMAIGQMLAAIVHDFKTPMTAICGFVELMTASTDADERAGYAEVVERQTDRMQDMIRDLLQFARGQTEVLLHKLFLERFEQEVKSLLHREFAASQSQLRIDTQYQGTVYMDENKMLRVVQNIARNAIQAMQPQGGGVFTLRMAQRDENLMLQCSDTGPGVPEEMSNNLYDSFATHGKEDGTGLGLAIVKKIVEEHHGSIDYQSTHEGTVFTILIPLQPTSKMAGAE